MSQRPRRTAPAPEHDRALQASHTQPFAPAIDAKGNADCQIGNSGYIDGPLTGGGRYPPKSVANPESPIDQR